jgi:AAA15 family ATPase/GTPase
MITSLNLNNFKLFKSVELDGIRPITLISGENNTGKTTILESVLL